MQSWKYTCKCLGFLNSAVFTFGFLIYGKFKWVWGNNNHDNQVHVSLEVGNESFSFSYFYILFFETINVLISLFRVESGDKKKCLQFGFPTRNSCMDV